MASVGMPDILDNPPTSPSSCGMSNQKTWQEIRQVVRRSRSAASAHQNKVLQCFTLRSLQAEDGSTRQRLYFLGSHSGNRENTLLFVDLDPAGCESEQSQSFEPRPLLVSPHTPALHGQLSRVEQLLRERKRMRSFGITSYDYHAADGRFVFPACNSFFICTDAVENGTFSMQPTKAKEVRSSNIQGRLDPKLCPSNANLLAFVSSKDIWVTNITTGTEQRLTYAHQDCSLLSSNPCSAGVPSFVVQEEFDRYTGYWWQPCSERNPDGSLVYRILYEEVDESDVDIISTVAPGEECNPADEFRYPRAGTPNAESDLKMLEFQVDASGCVKDVLQCHLNETLSNLFPEMEYLLRAGWTPDGKYVYVELIDRRQQRMQLALISPECFSVPKEGASENDDEIMTCTSNAGGIYILYEDTSDVWLQVHDLLHFLPQTSSSEMSFIWGSEKSGYRHLYHVTSSLTAWDNDCSVAEDDGIEHMSGLDSHCTTVLSETQLTAGEWDVSWKQIWVDDNRKLVYFLGYKDTPLETHLYVVPYDRPGHVVRLTEPFYSHNVYMDKACSLFVSEYSSVSNPPSCAVYRLQHLEDHQVVATRHGYLQESAALTGYEPPELFNFPSQCGSTLFGMVFKPTNLEPGRSYPTVVFVYAGPQVQLVTNSYKGARYLRQHTLASLGYAVVVIDSRGSCNRGLHFQSPIKRTLGQVEVEDQVEGLEWLASQVDYIDLSRVAIHGWSYGGYISLMALAKKPDVFKLAVAGAPVTSWSLYDTGYTERYMDLPSLNKDGYRTGSILDHVSSFPAQENRLLIIHGLIDENVHFSHTSALITALVKACKPYDLKIYPNERHGIRSPEANDHYETMLISYLQQHL